MMKRFLNICAVLFLLSLVACTSVPPQPTPVHIDSRPLCSLTLCQLPARPPLLVNDDWRQALDETEDELLSCAAQVLNCINLQQSK